MWLKSSVRYSCGPSAGSEYWQRTQVGSVGGRFPSESPGSLFVCSKREVSASAFPCRRAWDGRHTSPSPGTGSLPDQMDCESLPDLENSLHRSRGGEEAPKAGSQPG